MTFGDMMLACVWGCLIYHRIVTPLSDLAYDYLKRKKYV